MGAAWADTGSAGTVEANNAAASAEVRRFMFLRLLGLRYIELKLF
jgi:hypothetical protein